eukprot:10419177-Lingulodinium_polyedra.AAC.1
MEVRCLRTRPTLRRRWHRTVAPMTDTTKLLLNRELSKTNRRHKPHSQRSLTSVTDYQQSMKMKQNTIRTH